MEVESSDTSHFSQSYYDTTGTPTKNITELIENITFAPKRPVIKRAPLRYRSNNNNCNEDINKTPQRLGKRLQEDEHMTWAPKKARNLQNTPEKQKIEINAEKLLMAPKAPRPPKRLVPKSDITWAPKRPIIRIRRFPAREITNV